MEEEQLNIEMSQLADIGYELLYEIQTQSNQDILRPFNTYSIQITFL